MKIFKRIIFIVVLVSLSIGLLFVGNGYDMYKKAIEEISIEDKVAEIKSKENYANFSELPQMYKNNEDLKIEINVNKLDELVMTSLDADIKELEMNKLPKKFEFINNIAIPEEYKLESKYNVYTRENAKIQEYNVLHDYVFNYRKDSMNRIVIAFSEIDKPLRDYYIKDENKISKIGDTELIIFQYEEMFIASFNCQDTNFDVETTGITIDELVSLLQSMINGINIYSNSNYSNEEWVEL